MYSIYFTLHKGEKRKKRRIFPACFHNNKRNKKHLVHFFLAVLAAALNAAAVGAPFVPGFLIFSPLPAAILAFLAAILLYNPGLLISSSWVLP
jgi:hypothetical protein